MRFLLDKMSEVWYNGKTAREGRERAAQNKKPIGKEEEPIGLGMVIDGIFYLNCEIPHNARFVTDGYGDPCHESTI